MKALTLTQPWATLVALGHKRVETRSWSTRYRGPIAIHAAKGFPREALAFAQEERALGRIPSRIPRGAIVAVARLTECLPTQEVRDRLSGLERHLGDFSYGRWAWLLADIRALDEPIPCLGALGLWEVPPSAKAALEATNAATLPTDSPVGADSDTEGDTS